MPRPPIDTQEYKIQPDDKAGIAKAINELSLLLSLQSNRLARDAKTKTASYTMDPLSDRVILASGTITITLPDAAEADHTEYTVVNIGSGVITVATIGSGTINGLTTLGITLQYNGVTVSSDGTNYYRTDIAF